MKIISTCLILLLSIKTFSLELVQSTGKVTIKAPIEMVYDLVSSPMNDHLWRSEVNEMTTNNESVVIGSWYREDAWIGIRRNFITTTTVVEVDSPNKVVFVTPEGSPFYLKSRRFFNEENGETTFSYIVDFDRRMIKETFGLDISPQVVMKLYAFQMKRYLKKLKDVLER